MFTNPIARIVGSLIAIGTVFGIYFFEFYRINPRTAIGWPWITAIAVIAGIAAFIALRDLMGGAIVVRDLGIFD